MSTPSENGGNTPLKPVLRSEDDGHLSPRSGPVKVVSIAEPDDIIPLPPPEDLPRNRRFSTNLATKRMTGRPSLPSTSSSRISLASLNSMDDLNSSSDAAGSQHPRGESHPHHHHAHKHDTLLLQVAEWLQREKSKRAARRAKKSSKVSEPESEKHEAVVGVPGRPRSASQGSDSSSVSLEKLQRIVEDNVGGISLDSLSHASSSHLARRPSQVKTRRSFTRRSTFQGSDTEYQDGDVVVPTCDVVLDNSKTLSYSGGGADSSNETVTLSTSRRAEKERKAWLSFKNEILRLAHTLRLKGWRRVPLEMGGDIEVVRLSGALTNAVYVVSPPTELPVSSDTNSSTQHKPRSPPRLLLRIYGPQVEHLIDRENELGILRRLARNKIGPRLLGTFRNGRFEEYYNAQTLTAEDLRDAATSKQIAKRMRELHEGIELLPKEREEGPFIWKNWDKWVDRCEEITQYLDREILSGRRKRGEAWRERGLVCGVEWRDFKSVIDQYRKWLDEYYRGKGGVTKSLVFAHNDTQYGNILRLIPEPPSEGHAPSPLLLPQNTHKQLVVIDFEYASANVPGIEFANHFTEWCYNYHDPNKSWACDTSRYPTLEQQHAFVRSYVNHRVQFNPHASATPKMTASDGFAKGSISEFLLDSRTPGGSAINIVENSYAEDEARREQETERHVDALLKEAKIWRIANSAQWVSWGIVQAKVPELDVKSPDAAEINKPLTGRLDDSVSELDRRPEDPVAEAFGNNDTKEAEQSEDGEDHFDYLAYAQDRARFFWGDIVDMGFVKKEELPEELAKSLKTVEN